MRRPLELTSALAVRIAFDVFGCQLSPAAAIEVAVSIRLPERNQQEPAPSPDPIA